MKRRILSFGVALIILLSVGAPSSEGIVRAEENVNPFAAQDAARAASIEASLDVSDPTDFPLSQEDAASDSAATAPASEESAAESEPADSAVDNSVQTEESSAATRDYIVQFKPTCSLPEMADLLSGESYELLGYSEFRMICLHSSDPDAFRQKAGAQILSMEEDSVRTEDKEATDPYYTSLQWNLDLMHVNGAWDTTTGSDSVVVAVVDSGIYRGHQDFAGVTILNGYDYLENTICGTDTVGHGTEVAGVIAAAANNGVGIAGICWDVTILPYRFMYTPAGSTSATGSVSNEVSAILAAADAGADVINLSVGSSSPSTAENNAIQYAIGKNCIVVAAAGNHKTDAENVVTYPASYDNVISVASVTSSLSHSTFSNTNTYVDVSAPGSGIPTLGIASSSSYVTASGTSFSCPSVAAIAALARAEYPGITPAAFTNLLLASASDLGDTGYDPIYGYGIVDAQEVLQSLTQVKAFVTRFYSLCLGRSPDGPGLTHWGNVLLTGEQTGADVGYGFVFSPEFLGKEISDDAYVRLLYQAFFNRGPDSTGYSTWMTALGNGMSRYYVLHGFTNSAEFANFATTYNIDAGGLTLSAPVDLYPNITAFVSRFYQQCLGRSADSAGLADWVTNLSTGKQSGANVAYGFIFSPEFTAKNVSNDTYVKILYRAFFNRDPDPTGYANWMNQLNAGVSRRSVLSGFVNSDEFRNLCGAYGITPGTL